MRSMQFWVVLLFLVAAAALLHLRGDVDRVPASQPLSQLSTTIGSWTGREIPLDANVLEVLGKGVFLNRTYMPNGTFATVGMGGGDHLDAPVGLFIGYFPTQRTGQAIHSPQNCLPGAGWTFDTQGVTEFTDRNGKSYQVGEYLISNGKSRQEVLYWYRSHGRSIANDYMAKLYTLADSIRYNRTDAALVRVITPVGQGESQHDAHQRVLAFATQMAPLLPAYIPD
jgi:EpsI family protein